MQIITNMSNAILSCLDLETSNYLQMSGADYYFIIFIIYIFVSYSNQCFCGFAM